MKTIIQTPTNKLEESLAFYVKLGFETISKDTPNVVSDGQVIIEINPDRYARAGMKLFNENWQEIISELEKLSKIIKIKDGYALADPSGSWIHLMETSADIDFKSSQTSSSALGQFAGMSVESIDLEKSLQIWEILGFEKSMGSVDEGWISLVKQDAVTVSLMRPLACPHLFFNPSLTYFNGSKNLEIIDNIRKLQIPITEEITYFNKEGIVDNIIIRDPGGLGFFLFND
ncbi:MAG: hypothetical protein ISR55_11805 [Bacteroidetes bacterium]|nr:hypothetical protein [Bacteroidota bacterium]